MEELKHWRLDLACGRKTKYDHWLILRNFIENAYKDHGAIRKNVYERMMELDFVARSKTLDSLLPYRIWTQLFSQCQYLANVLYLALLSDVPIRPEEIGQIDWRDIAEDRHAAMDQSAGRGGKGQNRRSASVAHRGESPGAWENSC